MKAWAIAGLGLEERPGLGKGRLERKLLIRSLPMDVPFTVLFVPAFEPEKRGAQSFSVTSVITGSEVLVTKTALRDLATRRIADYRKAPLSRLLVLND